MTSGSETTEAIEVTVVGVVNVPDQWMRPRQPAGTRPAGPGTGWSSGRLVGSARAGPSTNCCVL